MRGLFAGIFCALTLMASPALAQQPAGAPFPYDQLPLNVVGVTPPEGWRVAHMASTGITVELGELMPLEQENGRWRDLLSYITAPVAVSMDITEPVRVDATIQPSCDSYASFNIEPSFAQWNERWLTLACVTRPSAQNALVEAPIELYLYRLLRSGDAQFQFWRAWRGTTGELFALLAKHRISAPLLSERPSTEDLLALEPALARLAEPWGAEINAAFEICDLTAGPCRSLNGRNMPGVTPVELPLAGPSVAAFAEVRGDRSNMAIGADYYRQLTRQPPPEFGDFAIVQTVSPENHDFRNANRAMSFGYAAVIASKAAGGMVAVTDDNPEALIATAPRLRAYLLKILRIVAFVPNGVPYDALSIDLWPEQ